MLFDANEKQRTSTWYISNKSGKKRVRKRWKQFKLILCIMWFWLNFSNCVSLYIVVHTYKHIHVKNVRNFTFLILFSRSKCCLHSFLFVLLFSLKPYLLHNENYVSCTNNKQSQQKQRRRRWKIKRIPTWKKNENCVYNYGAILGYWQCQTLAKFQRRV